MMQLIDSHIHLNFPEFKALDKHLEEARHNGVNAWIVPSTTLASIEPLVELVGERQDCFYAFGLHPYFMEQHDLKQIDVLDQYIAKYNPVAIGECGIDLMIENPQKDQQLALFKAHVVLARKYDLPLILHARKSLDLILKELRLYGDLKGVIHSFSGSKQQAEQVIELGFKLGFGGAVTYKRATRLRGILATIPQDSYLIETDAPDQPSAFIATGRLHYPKDLLYIAKEVATIRGETLETVANDTAINTKRLFGLKII